MGKQYKSLSQKDIDFIKEQKLFYIASSSGAEVNLSPKGYDSIRILDSNQIVFLNYSGSGNRTYRDAKEGGEFTLLFNSFMHQAKILRLFCKATIVEKNSSDFETYLAMFGEQGRLVRDFFTFTIYAVESSCGEGVPYMEYKGERKALRDWMERLDKNDKLEQYNQDHFTPPSLQFDSEDD